MFAWNFRCTNIPLLKKTSERRGKIQFNHFNKKATLKLPVRCFTWRLKALTVCYSLGIDVVIFLQLILLSFYNYSYLLRLFSSSHPPRTGTSRKFSRLIFIFLLTLITLLIILWSIACQNRVVKFNRNCS